MANWLPSISVPNPMDGFAALLEILQLSEQKQSRSGHHRRNVKHLPWRGRARAPTNYLPTICVPCLRFGAKGTEELLTKPRTSQDFDSIQHDMNTSAYTYREVIVPPGIHPAARTSTPAENYFFLTLNIG